MTTTETTTRPIETKLTRRKMLQSVAVASAVPLTAAMTGSALATGNLTPDRGNQGGVVASEAPHEKVHRLARELSDALHEYEGFKRATVTPEQVMFDDPEMPRPARSRHTGMADDLSFVVRNPEGGGFDYWDVKSTGNYSADCNLGRRLGEEYLAYIGERPTYGNATLLHCIVDSMMSRRQEPVTRWGQHTTGIEIGFLSAVNGYAMATAKFVHREATAV